jgi:hypothetical protein
MTKPVKGSYFLLSTTLETIRNFLDHVDREAGQEIESAMQRNEAGEFEEVDDFENALYFPVMRQEIAARAVFYEITALIESELQASATEPWLEADKFRGLQTTVHDLRFGEVVKMIERTYNVNIREFEGAETLFEIRETVNAFKHRDGRVSVKQDPVKYYSGKRHQADIEKAYEALEKAYEFITALWEATGR